MTTKTQKWYDTLTRKEKDDVVAWFTDNPPPKKWKLSKFDWAFVECPKGFLSGRYGSFF